MQSNFFINSLKLITLTIILSFSFILLQCENNNGNPTTSNSSVPELTTSPVSAITYSSAECGGTITSDGGATVTVRGVCWGITQNPTTSDNKTSDGDGAGVYTSILSDLQPVTKYYVRAYATNSAGTGYGSAMTFTSTASVPILTTSNISNITSSSANCGGNITSNGGTAVTERGVCWSTSANPTISDKKTNDGTGIGSFSSELTGLVTNNSYYVRAYAKNSTGVGYGNTITFSTPGPETGTMTDQDGNVYQTVKIGSQWWMSENLKVTHYRNGESIPNVTDNSEWTGLSTGAYCAYNNVDGNADTYSLLYNWYAVNDSRNIAPAGWHVPTDEEWQTLVVYLGGSSVAGGKMKETGTTHWNSPNTGATNESGFTALPGGYRIDNGAFKSIGGYGLWWSATASSGYRAWSRYLHYSSSGVSRYVNYRNYGFSVRLVRD